MIIYKYVTSDRIDILRNACIRFTQPSALNDPFDAFPCFRDYKKGLEEFIKKNAPKLRGHSTDEQIDSMPAGIDPAIKLAMEQLSDNYGILSLTKKKNNLLMWSHYTDSHKGFVIAFDSDAPFFKKEVKDGIKGLREVTYSDKRYVLPAGALESSTPAARETVMDHFFFTKSQHWSYEEELRVLAHPEEADRKISVTDGYPICLFKFPRDCVKEVIFGYRMDASTRKVFQALLAADYPHVKAFQCQLDDDEFELKVVPC